MFVFLTPFPPGFVCFTGVFCDSFLLTVFKRLIGETACKTPPAAFAVSVTFSIVDFGATGTGTGAESVFIAVANSSPSAMCPRIFKYACFMLILPLPYSDGLLRISTADKTELTGAFGLLRSCCKNCGPFPEPKLCIAYTSAPTSPPLILADACMLSRVNAASAIACTCGLRL